MIDLDGELNRAQRFVQRSGIAFPLSRRVQWGCARVDYFGRDRRCYEPSPNGRVMAFIAPCVEQGDLLDLAAIDQASDHVGFRLDIGHGLGLDVIEQARQQCKTLVLIDTAMAWLLDPVDTVWLRDLSAVAIVLAGVPVINCATVPLAERVMAFLPPSQRERVQAPL
jgi:hypothetical protein